MVEWLNYPGKKEATPDISRMLEQARQQIGAYHASDQPPMQPGSERTLDPTIYGGAHRERPSTWPDDYEPRQPILGKETLDTLDFLGTIFRHPKTAPMPPATALVDQAYSMSQEAATPITTTPVQETVTRDMADVPVQEPQEPDESAVEAEGEILETSFSAPAPGTAEALIFEAELREATKVVNRALRLNRQPRLVSNNFSPTTLAFFHECGYDAYLDATSTSAGPSFQELLAQAAVKLQQAQVNTRENGNRHPELRKWIKRTIGAAAATFVLFDGGYIVSRQVICAGEDLGSKAACGALSLGSIPARSIPILGSLTYVWEYPVKTFYSIKESIDGGAASGNNVEGKR